MTSCNNYSFLVPLSSLSLFLSLSLSSESGLEGMASHLLHRRCGCTSTRRTASSVSLRSATRAVLRSDTRQRRRVCMYVSDNDNEVMEQRTEEVEEMLMTKKRRGGSKKRKPPKLGRMRGETISRFDEEEEEDEDEEELTLKQQLWKVCVCVCLLSSVSQHMLNKCNIYIVCVCVCLLTIAYVRVQSCVSLARRAGPGKRACCSC